MHIFPFFIFGRRRFLFFQVTDLGPEFIYQVLQVGGFFFQLDDFILGALALYLHLREQAGLQLLLPDGYCFLVPDLGLQAFQLAFLGSVAFARFLATYPNPHDLMVWSDTGESGEDDDE